ncbi:MAG: hypothetical protein ACE5FJ_02730 [Gemmatimonadales bacterium]
MSKTEWALFAGIVGAVMVAIAVEPNHQDMAGHDPAAMVMEETPTSQTVTLAVTGMT